MPKICSHTNCNTPVFSKGFCQHHWRGWKASQPLAQTDQVPAKPFRIKPVSTKQAKLNAIYNVAAAQFKKDKPYCMARLQGCTGATQHVHHLFSGASRSKYFLDEREWCPVCNHCHRIIHDILSKEEAIKLGLKKIE